VAKHAAATKVVISVDHAGNEVVITITDDGRGGATITEGGGLGGLRDRVDAVGGTLDVHSPPEEGTTVIARLPSGR
jgi:signal transduction histidine kinase